MALGYIVILFVFMVVVSIIGLVLMNMLKNEKAQKVVFYIMAAWALVIAVASATSMPNNYIASQGLAWGIGFLSIIGLILQIKSKAGKSRAAYVMVTISVVAGAICMFV